MSSKLFISTDDAKNAILLISQAEVFKCIIGSSSYTYTKDAKEGTFTGELRVKDIPFCKLDQNTLETLKKEMEFGSIEEAHAILAKMQIAAPEIQEKHDVVGEKLLKKPMKLSRVSIEDLKGYDIKEDIKAQPEAVAKTPAKSQEPETKKEGGADEKKLPVALPINTQARGGLSKKAWKKLSEKQKNELLAKQPQAKIKVIPPPISEVVEVPSYAKVDPKQLAKEDENGYIKVDMGLYAKGFFIGHLYPNSKKEMEAIILCTPKIGESEDSHPMIFSQERVAKFVFEALLRHPRHKKLVDRAIVRPIDDLDEEAIKGITAALIQNGATFVNKLEEIPVSTQE